MKKKSFFIALVPSRKSPSKVDKVGKKGSASDKARKRFREQGFSNSTITKAVRWARKNQGKRSS